MTLTGWRIIVMRPQDQAEPLCDAIVSQGGEAILLPMLEIHPKNPSENEQTTWHSLIEQADYVIVVSPNALRCLPLTLKEVLREKRDFTFVTMGQATAAAYLNHPNLWIAPPGSTSESVLDHPEFQERCVKNKNIVLLAGEGGRTVIAQTLMQRGAHLHWVKTYSQRPPDLNLAPYYEKWQQEYGYYSFVATSLSVLENLVALTPSMYHSWLYEQPLIVVSERIGQVAKMLGFQDILVSGGAYLDAIIEALQWLVLSRV